jgi:PST family polysaccharide transporter/lipopolysaccharide exporter
VPLPRWNRQAIRELMPYTGPATLACFAWTGFRNGDYAIISARLGAAQAGLYWRAYQLAVEYQKKISTVMTQIAFPVLARAVDEDEMLALRRRMVRVLTVILFPLLIMLVLVAPALVPWLFGDVWTPAVVPMQILALGGAATLVIDAVAPALMATGRAKALLAYGVGHFVIYVGAVVLVSGRGIAAVATAATVVHAIFLVIAYQVMLRRGLRAALRAIWVDVSAATVACVALAAVAGPANWALDNAGAPVLVQLALVGGTGGLAYLVALRAGFPEAWRDLSVVLRRILPGRVMTLIERLPASRRPVLEP